MREPPSDFSFITVTVPGMSLSESHLLKIVSQRSPDPDNGGLTEESQADFEVLVFYACMLDSALISLEVSGI